MTGNYSGENTLVSYARVPDFSVSTNELLVKARIIFTRGLFLKIGNSRKLKVGNFGAGFSYSGILHPT